MSRCDTRRAKATGSSPRAKARCWGDNFFGQLGIDDTDNRNFPVVPSPSKGWSSITAGLYHTCGVRYRVRWCWGWNVLGQLGQTQSANERHVPYRIIESGISWSTSPQGISAGAHHTCAVGTSGGVARLYCWGYNSSGQLGLGDYSNRFVPTVVTSTPVVAIAAGTHHTCIVRGDGRRACTGANSYGQLGTYDTTSRTSWTLISDSVTWRSISAGTDHTCAISTGNALYCWGSNNAGKLGLGGGSYRISPTQVLG